LGIGDWGLGPIPNPQSPIPNPHIRLNTFLSIINKNQEILKIKNNKINMILIQKNDKNW
jgi:hypothetical protein